jgi:hypothetical protein
MAYINDIDYQNFVKNLISPLSLKDEQSKLSTLGLGLAGEVGEVFEVLTFYDKDKLIKELGDVLWYITFGCVVLEIQINDLFDIDDNVLFDKNLLQPTIATKQLVINIGKVCETIKKHLYHGKDLCVETLKYQLSKVLVALLYVCHTYCINIEEVKQRNFEKLSERYASGKFTKQDFLRRKN